MSSCSVSNGPQALLTWFTLHVLNCVRAESFTWYKFHADAIYWDLSTFTFALCHHVEWIDADIKLYKYIGRMLALVFKQSLDSWSNAQKRTITTLSTG